MPATPAFPLRIFYDGSCPVCAAEIEGYGRKDREGRLVLVDISAPGFDPAPYGIRLADFMYQMHAIDAAGTVYRGVDALWAIWQAFPASTLHALLGTLVTFPPLVPALRLCYRGFARIRGYLPKRRRTCADGTCGIDKVWPG